MVSLKSKATGLLFVATLLSSSVYPMHIQETDRGTVTLNESSLRMPVPNRQYFHAEASEPLMHIGMLLGTSAAHAIACTYAEPIFRSNSFNNTAIALAAYITGAGIGMFLGNKFANWLDRDARAKHDEKQKEQADYYKKTRGYNIFWAAAKDLPLALQAHIDAKVSPFSKDQQGQTPLMYAAAHNAQTTAKCLLSEYRQSNFIRNLLIDSKSNAHQTISFADINAQDNNGNTALLIAAKAKHPEIVKLLIRKGANINISDRNGVTVASLITSGHLKGITHTDLVYAPDAAAQIERKRGAENSPSLPTVVATDDATGR